MLSTMMVTVAMAGERGVNKREKSDPTQTEQFDELKYIEDTPRIDFISYQKALIDAERGKVVLKEVEEKERIEAEERRIAAIKAEEERIAREKEEAEKARIAAEAKAKAEARAIAEAKQKAENERKVREQKQQQSKKAKAAASSGANGNYMTAYATHYTAYCDGCSGITKTGINARASIYHNGMRVIAVDPSVIPLNSIVEVVTPHQTFTAIAGDTGGAIKGNKIDILVGSKEEAYRLGVYNVKLRIIK